MPIPATAGSFRLNMLDAQIGDFIAFRYAASASAAGNFEFGIPLATAQLNEIPVTGAGAPNGYAYALKAAPGMMISDRVVQQSISWSTLHSAKYIQGKKHPFAFNLIPKMGSATTPAPFKVTASTWYSSDYAYKVFDRVSESQVSRPWWYVCSVAPVGGHWLKVDCGAPLTISRLALSSFLYSGAAYALRHWEFYGSNDDVNYNLIRKGMHLNNGDLENYELPTVSYQYYRINCLTNWANDSSSIGIQEMILSNAKDANISIRSLTGGVAPMDAEGNPGKTDLGLGGWPAINEWDSYITRSTLGGKIKANDDAVWHHRAGVFSWCQESNSPNVVGSTSNKVIRPYNTLSWSYVGPDNAASIFGFRPVFTFIEKDAKASNIWN